MKEMGGMKDYLRCVGLRKSMIQKNESKMGNILTHTNVTETQVEIDRLIFPP